MNLDTRRGAGRPSDQPLAKIPDPSVIAHRVATTVDGSEWCDR